MKSGASRGDSHRPPVLVSRPALVLVEFPFFSRVLLCESLWRDTGIALKSPDQKTRGFVV
jgi:hypothetical protein